MKTAEVNGIIGGEDEDNLSVTDEGSAVSGGVYKQRYERAVRELEYTKRRLQQQHHDDLEQLIALRKQLEKKVSYSCRYKRFPKQTKNRLCSVVKKIYLLRNGAISVYVFGMNKCLFKRKKEKVVLHWNLKMAFEKLRQINVFLCIENEMYVRLYYRTKILFMLLIN